MLCQCLWISCSLNLLNIDFLFHSMVRHVHIWQHLLFPWTCPLTYQYSDFNQRIDFLKVQWIRKFSINCISRRNSSRRIVSYECFNIFPIAHSTLQSQRDISGLVLSMNSNILIKDWIKSIIRKFLSDLVLEPRGSSFLVVIS